MSSKANFYCGEWLIEPQTLTISHPNKGKCSVQSKVMQVLLVLINANNQVVEKRELMDVVWHGAVITENSLNQTISELRKIFGDSRKDPKFIETIPGKGYRFVTAAQSTSDSSLDIIKSSRPSSQVIALFVSALLIVGFIFWPNSQLESARFNLTVAPNGQAIAYFMKQNTGYYLHIQDTDSNRVPITIFVKTPESLALGWSSDSSKVVYNATLAEDSFYAMNVFDLNNAKTLYYKAAKLDQRHQQDSLPENFNKAIDSVDHEEFMVDGNKVDKIRYSEGEYFSAYFDQGKITSFSWQSVLR